MLRFLSEKLSADGLIVVVLVVLAGFTVYLRWPAIQSQLGSSAEEPQKAVQSTNNEQVKLSDFSLYPSQVESFDNGSYSLRLNEQLRIKFIRLPGSAKISWPRDLNDKRVVTVHDTRLTRELAKVLVSGQTVAGTAPLEITGVEPGPEKETAAVTFNEELTIHNVKLSQPGGLKLGWPSRSYYDRRIPLISADKKLRDELVNRLRQVLEFNSELRRDPVFEPPENGRRAEVIQVFDGDTIKVRLRDGTGREMTVRIKGIDCPESSRNQKCESSQYVEGMSCAEEIPYGKRATRIAKSWLANNNVILVPGTESGEFERGHYGRLLAYVRLRTGEDYGLKMVENGYCKDFSDAFPHPRSTVYRRLQTHLKPLD